MERESALAQMRSLADENEPIEEPDEPQRWLRGRLEPHPDGFEVSVNSEERLQALVELLGWLGAEPELSRRSVIDPAQDMPPIRLGIPMPFGASQDAVDAWQELWARGAGPGARRRDPAHRVEARAEPAPARGRPARVRARRARARADGQARPRSGPTTGGARYGALVGSAGTHGRSGLKTRAPNERAVLLLAVGRAKAVR
jgi:hypothetical protein